MVLNVAHGDENPFVEAGNKFGIDPMLLWSIAKVESNLNPRAINKNKNGTYDMGIMQINSVHLPRLKKYGILPQDLAIPRINIDVGAWVLSGCIQKHGYKWNAVTCYNGRIANNPYGYKVFKVLKQARQSSIVQHNEEPPRAYQHDLEKMKQLDTTPPTYYTLTPEIQQQGGNYLVIDTTSTRQ